MPFNFTLNISWLYYPLVGFNRISYQSYGERKVPQQDKCRIYDIRLKPKLRPNNSALIQIYGEIKSNLTQISSFLNSYVIFDFQ